MKSRKQTILVWVISLLFTITLQAQYNYLGSWDNSGVPDYLEAENDNVESDLLQRIKFSLPDGKKVESHHPEWLADGTQTNIHLSEQSDVFVTFVTEGAGYKNVLGFYYYQADSPPQQISDIEETMTIIFPNASELYSGGGLVPGNKVKLGNFPANTVIGWFLLANGWGTNGLTNGHWRLFSNPVLNPESNPSLRQHNILLNDDATGKIILGFEDIRRDNSGCDHDFEDALYYVTTTVEGAIDTSDIPETVDPNPSYDADLALVKTLDNDSPADGDEIKYTLTVTNNGPDEATTIEIEEYLPEGLAYISHNVSVGTYTLEDGLWAIDKLANGASATLSITAKVTLQDISQGAFDLGAAKGFNLFALKDVSQPSADTEGKLAAGRNIYLSQYSVGDLLPDSGGEEDVLIAGKDLIFLSGTVTGGNVVYGKNTNLPTDQVSIHNGTVRKDNVIDFAAAAINLRSLSNQLKAYPVTGTTEWEFSGLKLTGSEPFLNVFKVDAQDLSDAVTLTINVPNGSVVLVNVFGENVDWSGDLDVYGTSISNVLYNFNKTKGIKIQSIDVRGSILAPWATLEFPAGVINGQVIVKNIYGTGQFNSGENNETHFVGLIPVSDKIVNSAVITSLDQTDADTTNNYSEVTLTLQGFSDPGNTSNDNWDLVGSFESGEIVWTINEDKDGNMLSGTWGGKINRSTDDGTTWERINSSMNVGFLWAIEVDGDNIFAGTEMGLYLSTDNGTTWNTTSLVNKDVRSLLLHGDNLYAGVWGGGVYKSTDNGTTWTSVSKGYTNASVNALVADGDGNIYAGTFDYGVLKSEDDGDNWTMLDIDTRFVWSMVVNSSGTVFAGTYGEGVFKSLDGGTTWFRTNNNLGATHIYSMRKDTDDNIYATGWSSGVYVLPGVDKEDDWGSLGMFGLDVSSLYVDTETNRLFAGTADGNFYVNDSPLTAVEDEPVAEVVEYGLSQNYPNPFNPATTINFSLRENTNVRLAVYSILGEEVAVLINSNLNAGTHNVSFDASKLSTGVYIYRIETPNFTDSKKMILIK